MPSSPNTCQTLCIAQSFDFPSMSKYLLEHNRTQLFKDALLIDHQNAYSMVFAYGVVVHWNANIETRRKLQKELLRFAINPLTALQEDNFSYVTNMPHNKIQHDRVELETNEDKVLLALSHAMAQSIKLSTFELQAQETISTTRHLPSSLARTGRIQLSKTALAKIRGELFLTKSDINLNYELLDTPEFFWEHPEYQTFYSMAANYLELTPRTEVLGKKLETIHELLEMLADEQKHQHSSTLEWIIIWLIAVEIAITLIEKLN
jgi:uncharacterized Rmd1/YagE family protein